MARRARFAQAQFALWPDEGLLEAVRSFPGERINILRTELDDGRDTLTVDLADEFYRASGEDGWQVGPDGRPDPRHHGRLLRLTWESRWEGSIYHGNRIFALESYDEFYGGPYGTFHPTRQGLPPSFLYEVVSDPDPWITEILEENDNTDTFPPYGVPVAVSEKLRAREPQIETTGRFFPENARPSDTGSGFVYSLGRPAPTTPEQWAEAQAQMRRLREAQWQAQRRRPRYRHLLLASGTHILEVLCEDLPTWAWVGGS
ncbi:hypothetical protein E5F05_15380 [Deinococcus metallilatus]|uniref:Uncharacterized protein n=1 Tax=Deinococcus metallilatus TaxID=1211322 RepID=A0AAJ5JXT7_9DEIO|nr:hypothetical protein [Deinococcus metallilatus]MBB5296708.1 hypothetical protein [Deinococcus metallilatus]QBY09212.1 hypothetical protein E5F05_15380 [Deinococcus metallilatus]RXJ09730.1 hypothetical protein ERJ73_14210 [Deinococcus metallilatus]TLK24196.1 hypothetical protein FCS05_15170 [Deinococcus metallilatus]GMA13739.1 hypothetical protein GCM10025871_00700 [Deinococcus metallilatus]